VQISWLQSQRFRGMGIVSAVFLDRFGDQAPFRVGNRLMIATDFAGPGLFQQRLWQVFRDDKFAGSQRYRPLQRIFEFANVAGPIVALPGFPGKIRRSGGWPWRRIF